MKLPPRLLLAPLLLLTAPSVPLIAQEPPRAATATPAPVSRERDLRDEILAQARKEKPLPIPTAVTLAEVIGGDWPEAHAFFIKLPSTTALVVCTSSTTIDEVRVNGKPVAVGRLLRRPPISAYRGRGAWVWEATLPAGIVPLLRPKATLPLMVHSPENWDLMILTAAGPRVARLAPKWSNDHMILPGEGVPVYSSVDVQESQGFASIKVGDPIVHRESGIVIGGVIEGDADDPLRCHTVFLTFPEPPEKLKAPLTEVWGLKVAEQPTLDEAFVRSILPVRALSSKLGEKMEDVWKRNPFLSRGVVTRMGDPWALPLVPAGGQEFFGEEWAFREHGISAREGVIDSVRYHPAYLNVDQASLLTTWLAQKFGDPIELRLTKDKTDFRAVWKHAAGWVTFCCAGNASSPNLTADLDIRAVREEGGNGYSDMNRYTEPVKASRVNLLQIMQAMGVEVRKAKRLDDGGSLFRKVPRK